VRLPARLARLETAKRNDTFIIMWRHHTETNEQAEARWRAEHPGEDPKRAGVRVIMVRWVRPQSEARVAQ
jgi:hypothetical protein